MPSTRYHSNHKAVWYSFHTCPLTCLGVSLLAWALPTAGAAASSEDGIDPLPPGSMTPAILHPAPRRRHLPQGDAVQVAGDWQVGQPLELPGERHEACFYCHSTPLCVPCLVLNLCMFALSRCRHFCYSLYNYCILILHIAYCILILHTK